MMTSRDAAQPAEPAHGFASFAEFYPYYLSEHRDPRCRALHYLGSSLVIAVACTALVLRRWSLLWLLPFLGYGFAWAGHLFFERNKPATFRYPWWSFLGDWVMLKDFLLGREVQK